MRLSSFCLLALALVPCIGQALELPPLSTAGESGISFHGGTFADTTFENVPYVTSDLVDSLFGGVTRWVPGAQQLHLRDGKGREWVFSIDNPFFTIDGAVFNLTYPVRRDAEGLYLPFHPLCRLLRLKFGFNLKSGIPAKAGNFSAQTGKPGNITGFDIEERRNGTLLRVRTVEELKWEGLLSPPYYLLKLDAGRFAPACPTQLDGKGLVQNMVTVQEKDLAQLTLRLNAGYDTVEILRDSTLPGILVNIHKAQNVSKKPQEPPVGARQGRGTIIVDAGHGGKDRGAVVRGVEEATVTLAVAKELKKALLKLGYKVRLTRENDTYKTLAERPKFASDNGGDVFVSLHCNSLGGSAASHRDITGHTVYILREGESEEDKALARRENQAIHEESGKSGKNEIAPVDWIVLEHQLNLYSKQSEALAESIVKTFEGFDIPKYSTGARQAGFFVLVGAYMPAVLFEMGFLTHPKDRRILASKSGQREIARRMAEAVDKFRRAI